MSYKILIVDDVPKNIQMLANILDQERYEIEFATNGGDALSWVNNSLFDLILLDIMMPGMDGYEVCRLIKNNPLNSQTPVVFLTARSDLDSITKGFQVGAVDYVTKPFDKEELLCRVRTHLELKSARQKLQTINEQLESIVELRTEELKLNNKKLETTLTKFKAIFDNSSDAIYLTDKKGKFLEVNAKFCEVFGRTHEELIRMSISELFKDLPPVVTEHSYQLNGIKTEDFEAHYQATSGKNYVFECKSSFINIDQQQCVLFIARDVTLRMQLQKEILAAVLKTEEKERQRFAKDLHDGLGPILSTAKFYIKSLEKESNDKERKFLIEKSTLTVDEAISNIKLISKNLSPYVLRDFGLVAAIKEFNKNMVIANKIRVEFRADINKRLHADLETALYRIYTELINNTLKYANATQVEIQYQQKDDMINFFYRDNGCGFDIDKAFEKKTGMGLSNILTRSQALGGVVNFISSEDKGMSVSIALKLT